MKITVIGAGAIGTLLAALLVDDETNVSILTKKENEGLRRITLHNFNDKTIKQEVRFVNRLDKSDWYILAVKSYHIEEIIDTLKNTEAKILC